VLAAAWVLASLLACSKTIVVTHPPAVDLKALGTIGVVPFRVDGVLPGEHDVTHRFLATMQASQPGVRLLELGPEQDVLAAVGKEGLGIDAVKAIGARYGVDALLTGRLAITEARPSVFVGPNLDSLHAGASVHGSLQARLQETRTAATVWTNGAHGDYSLGSLHLTGNGGPPTMCWPDADSQYETMLGELVAVTTNNFRPTYERRRVAD
jgi:hypothetical protein